MTRVANVMALAFSSSNTNVEQLGYAMKYAAPQAKALGFSIEQTAAIVSKLRAQFRPGPGSAEAAHKAGFIPARLARCSLAREHETQTNTVFTAGRATSCSTTNWGRSPS